MTPQALFLLLFAFPVIWGWTLDFVMHVGATIMRDMPIGRGTGDA